MIEEEKIPTKYFGEANKPTKKQDISVLREFEKNIGFTVEEYENTVGILSDLQTRIQALCNKCLTKMCSECKLTPIAFEYDLRPR